MNTDNPPENFTVQHDDCDFKFYIETNAGEAVLDYKNKGNNVLDLKTTFVPKELRGKGVAQKLVKQALDYAQERHFEIIPSCPVVQNYISKHPEYADLKVNK